MGGLSAATFLAQKGVQVTLFESRSQVGGLAGSFVKEGLSFDAGPYVLLDYPGLSWALERLKIPLGPLDLVRVQTFYSLQQEGAETVRIESDLKKTADSFEAKWPGAGGKYKEFIAFTQKTHKGLQPMLYRSNPGLWDLFQTGAWRHIPFLLRSLDSVLQASQLPEEIQSAIAIWTGIAGQKRSEALAPLGFVPSLIHGVGAYVPRGGIGVVPEAVEAAALKAGVTIRTQEVVEQIEIRSGKATGVILETGEICQADAVISNAGLGTYLKLAPSAVPPQARRWMGDLPLQGPGVCIYMKIRNPVPPPLIRFFQDPGSDLWTLITPGAMFPERCVDGWYPARIIAPLHHSVAQSFTEGQQKAFAEKLLQDPKLKPLVGDYEVLEIRTPKSWGQAFRLYEDSMNPVMTAQFMRRGRLAHRSPYLKGLYLAGSASHPGQWISFCAISGVLAAELILKDLGFDLR